MLFTVDVMEVWTRCITVELPKNATVEQIREQANLRIQESDEGVTEYSRTRDPETWTVRDSSGRYL